MMSATASMTCPAALHRGSLPARRPAAQKAMRTSRSAGLVSVAPAQRESLKQSTRRGLSCRTQAGPMEVAQLAGEFAEISGYATVMFAITLVGLAGGFVLLRFESLVEEGKLDNLLK